MFTFWYTFLIFILILIVIVACIPMIYMYLLDNIKAHKKEIQEPVHINVYIIQIKN